MPDGPPNLPALTDARLPATYEAAQRALSECSRVDECKNWSDKAQALASYARQAKDSTLHNLALRIQARAQRRMGELLKQIPSGQGANLTAAGREGAHPILTRERAADDGGLSEHQRKTAQRVASIPTPEFEAAIESAQPPSITELATRGTVPRPPAPEAVSAPAAAAVAQRAQSLLRELAVFCATSDPAAIAVSPTIDADMLRGYVETIDAWLDRFVTRLPGDEGQAA
jgi:hypothetical protein